MKLMTDEHLDLLKNLPEEKRNYLRQKRVPLLNAFDKLKGNVNFGVESLTDSEKKEIIYWYKALLDIEEWAFKTIPQRVARYL